MDSSQTTESFRGLLLRHRGRTGLTQRELGARLGAARRTVQDWVVKTRLSGRVGSPSGDARHRNQHRREILTQMQLHRTPDLSPFVERHVVCGPAPRTVRTSATGGSQIGSLTRVLSLIVRLFTHQEEDQNHVRSKRGPHARPRPGDG